MVDFCSYLTYINVSFLCLGFAVLISALKKNNNQQILTEMNIDIMIDPHEIDC